MAGAFHSVQDGGGWRSLIFDQLEQQVVSGAEAGGFFEGEQDVAFGAGAVLFFEQAGEAVVDVGAVGRFEFQDGLK